MLGDCAHAERSLLHKNLQVLEHFPIYCKAW